MLAKYCLAAQDYCLFFAVDGEQVQPRGEAGCRPQLHIPRCAGTEPRPAGTYTLYSTVVQYTVAVHTSLPVGGFSYSIFSSLMILHAML